MIKKLFFLIIFTFFAGVNIYSASDTLYTEVIQYYDAEVKLIYGNTNNLTGKLSVEKDEEILYSEEGTYSMFARYKQIDLNIDGSKELMLYLYSGSIENLTLNMYIFDIKRGYKPLYSIVNGRIDTINFRIPKITSTVDLSTVIFGICYTWAMEYKDDKLVLYTPVTEKEKVYFRPEEEMAKVHIYDYYKGRDSCSNRNYLVSFENIFICYKITGEDYKAYEFFKEHYKCRDKKTALKRFRAEAFSVFYRISDGSLYKIY